MKHIRKRRGRIQVILDILKTIMDNNEQGCLKTTVIYKANLNWSIFKKYRKILEEKGLIITEGNEYMLTIKGKDVLHYFKQGIMKFQL